MLTIDKQKVRALMSGETPNLFLSKEQKEKIQKEHTWLLNHIENKTQIYGVNTGFGKNVESFLTKEQSEKLQENLSAYLDCAQGEPLGFETSRLTFLARIKHITSGNTGVSLETVDYLVSLFNQNIAPVIYPEGSLGASGDLVTMAPLARLLIDDSTLCWKDNQLTSLKDLGVKPLGKMGPRDALCLMNGLSNAASMLCVEVEKTRDLLNLSMNSLLMAKFALCQDFSTEHPHLHEAPVRQFSGQSTIAQFFWQQGKKLKKSYEQTYPLQDEYSLRCMTQVIAPLWELFQQVDNWAYQEINSQSDNPRIELEQVLNGGNFYGGYLAFASDHLAHIQIKLAELLDRQSFHLVSGKRSLPTNLIHQKDHSYFHGLKGIHQISNSFYMNLLKEQHNFALNTRSCESHNQDMVSNCANGIIRLKSCRENFSKVLTAHLVLSCQAIDLLETRELNDSLSHTYNTIRQSMPYLDKDIPLGKYFHALNKKILSKKICEGVF